MSNLVDFRFIEDYDVDKITSSFTAAIKNLNFESKLKEGQTVLLTVCMPQKADKDSAICTHPAVVEAVVKVLSEYNVKCILATSPYGKYDTTNLNNVYLTSGMLEVANKTDLVLNEDLSTSNEELPTGQKTKGVTLLDIVNKVDYIINIGKVKFDDRLGYLGAATNLFGLIPGEIKNTYLNRLSTQRDYHNLIVDLYSLLEKKLALNILDGIVVREQSGSPRMLSVLLTGTKAFSVDALLLNILNIDYSNTIIKVASERGAINIDACFKLVGDSISSVNEVSILPHSFNLDTRINYDTFSTRNYFNKHQQLAVISPNKCKGCCVCSKICPTGAIMMKYDANGELYACIDYKKCIHCKKCVTACPYKVVKVKTPVAAKRMNKTLQKYNTPKEEN